MTQIAPVSVDASSRTVVFTSLTFVNVRTRVVVNIQLVSMRTATDVAAVCVGACVRAATVALGTFICICKSVTNNYVIN